MKRFKTLREGSVVGFPPKDDVRKFGAPANMKHLDNAKQFYARRQTNQPGINNPAKVIKFPTKRTYMEMNDSIAHRMHAYPVGSQVKHNGMTSEVVKVKYSNDPNTPHYYKLLGIKDYVPHHELKTVNEQTSKPKWLERAEVKAEVREGDKVSHKEKSKIKTEETITEISKKLAASYAS
ncbi:MAG: hypothetical protein ACRDFB_05190, partial [Rhabdochlamydiaceae bacterium]